LIIFQKSLFDFFCGFGKICHKFCELFFIFFLTMALLVNFFKNTILLRTFCLFRINNNLSFAKKSLEPKPWNSPYGRRSHDKISIFYELCLSTNFVPVFLFFNKRFFHFLGTTHTLFWENVRFDWLIWCSEHFYDFGLNSQIPSGCLIRFSGSFSLETYFFVFW
jgi:hypothetical protein